ncbi:autotransporter assembly complex protein TamA [Pseudomonas saliphila]|uniref:autotransporter assembly complex protein TamA n=1 Tax=Pseudomonas saliphila TaxID=2586906 RepID=UPI0012398801|nr:autotransporter assembly complex family protein [Pseudomonas saliphila]
MARPFPSAYLLVCLLFLSAAGQAELRVNLEPANTAVRNNIEAFIGPVEAESRREMWRLARHSQQQATDAAKALGYYDVRVRPRVTGSNDAPVLELNVNLGEPVRLRNVDIRVTGPGEGTAAFRRPDSPRLAPGAKLHHGHYESAKSLISNQALRYGYFSGRFTESRLLIDPEAKQADISLLYDSGRRYRLGEVTFSETPFTEELLRSMVTFESGEAYDSELIAEFNRDLLSTGYFENVQVLAPASQAVDGVIPVQATLSARKPHSLGFGGGYSTDVGARGRVSWTQHWLNEHGHSRGADLEISLPRQQITTWYQIPLDPPQSSSLRFFTGVQKEEIEDVETESFVIGALHQRRLDNGWERAIGLRLEEERFTVGNDEGDATLLIPSIGFNRLKSDGGMDPSQGYSLAFEVQGAKEGFISDFDFLRVTSTARGLYTVQDRHRLLARAQLGAIASESFERIPPSLRFFAGGDQSVRGYDFRTLSPIDETGDHIGGRYLVAGSLEYQYEFIEKWRGAVFVDHGNAVDSLEDPLETSVGVGIRWVSPIGPIRLDLAKSMSDPEQGFRIHFAMGPEL